MKRRFLLILLLLALAASVFGAACGGGTKYTVTFETNGGSPVASQTLAPGADIVVPNDPVKEYFTFDGWYGDQALTSEYRFGKMPSADITLYAGWIGDKTSTIRFDSDGGSAVDDIVALSGTVIEQPDDPVKTGYVFDGWYNGDQRYTFGKMPEQNLVLTAKWTASREYAFVTLVLDGDVYETVPVRRNQTLAVPALSLPAGVNVGAWCTDETYNDEYLFGSMVTADFTLYAVTYSEGLSIEDGVVVGYTGASSVVIPAYYDGQAVTAIGADAFFGNQTIESVRLPETVTVIGKGAFYNCSYLTEINLSDQIVSIGSYAFYSCVRLRNAGTMGGLTEVAEGVFDGCKDLRSVTFSASLRSVGAYAFADCAALTSIDLGDSVQTIRQYAMSGSGIVSFRIPKNLVSLGEGAFDGCDSLLSVSVAQGNTQFATDDGNLYTDGKSTLLLYLPCTEDGTDKGETSFGIQGFVTKIAPGAFSGNTNLKSVSFENANRGLRFELGTLKGMENLETLTLNALPENYETGETYLAYLFGASTAVENGQNGNFVPASLKKVRILSAIGTLPAYAFYGCTGVEEIEGLDTVTWYEAYSLAFTGLKEISVSGSVGFENNDPISVFAGCKALTAINFTQGSGGLFQSYDGCIYNADYSELLLVPAGKQTISYHEELTVVRENAFAYTTMESLVIPDTVKRIENGAVKNASRLAKLTVPFIGGSSSENQYLLYIFGGIKTEKTGSSGEITVEWTNPNSAPARLSSVTVTARLSEVPAFAFAYCSGLTEVSFGEGSEIAAIGAYAYYSTGVSELPLGDQTEIIGAGAFSACNNLTNVVIPGTVKEIGAEAFSNCANLASVVIEEGVEVIGDMAFASYYVDYETNLGTTIRGYHSSMTAVSIASSVKTIGAAAFAYAGAYFQTSNISYTLNSAFALTIAPNSKIETIGDLAFYYSAINSLYLPSTLKTIGVSAFENCALLTNVEIGDRANGSEIQTFGGRSFGSCLSLKSLIIYKNVAVQEDVPTVLLYSSGDGNQTNFLYGSDNCKIYVPDAALSYYKSAEIWSEYTNLCPLSEYKEGGEND